MSSKLLRLCWLSCVLVTTGCASAGPRARDYIFGVTGVVMTEDGTPLKDAEVVLKVTGPVYAAVSPVVEERRLTDATGGFVFMYNSHRPRVEYTITVQMEGFTPDRVSGAAPPAGHHTIRLKKAVR